MGEVSKISWLELLCWISSVLLMSSAGPLRPKGNPEEFKERLLAVIGVMLLLFAFGGA